jgi:hypothetical protein
MKAKTFSKYFKPVAASLAILFFIGCERDIADLETASYPANPDVFVDGFSAGLEYAVFAGTVPTAFSVDNETTYNSTDASMRIEIPDAGDPKGAYAGGVYFTTSPRDLSGFTALTFWAKASKAATVDLVGFGNDMGANKFQTTISNMPVNTNWKKYIIPIPDPSKLTAEKGMFFYSEGPEDGRGYTLWIDELKFENMGTIAHPKYAIFNGNALVESSFNGVTRRVDGIQAIFNMPTGINQSVNISPAYSEFFSSNPSVATVDENGLITVLSGGIAQITATVNGVNARGSLNINSKGDYQSAPEPTHPADDVISIYTDKYPNVQVDYYNGYWEPWQTTVSDDFEVNGDFVLNYVNFNFVGIQFTSPTVDATQMTHLHINLYFPNNIAPGSEFDIELVDAGPDGVLNPGNPDEVKHRLTFTTPTLASQQWITLDIPLANFTNLTSRSNLTQIIFEGRGINSFYADNIYFHK